jgi:hypothetical protein
VLGLRGIPQLALRLGVVDAQGLTPRRPVDEVTEPAGGGGPADPDPAGAAARPAEWSP